ncbi:MAG: Crp/Fnr family transcriptional regulator [Mailhella sp.]|nr:Crp/Fnr family transcriptional regulator [Mailhella sp.]
MESKRKVTASVYSGDIHYANNVISIRELNSVWREVLHLGKHQFLAKGTRRTCLPQDDFFGFLDKGLLRLSSLNSEGSERIALYIEKGCIFNEQSCMQSAPMTTAFFLAMEDSEVWFFPRSLLRDRKFVLEYPQQMINLVQSLSQKTGAFFSQLDENFGLPLEASVCRYLYRAVEKDTSIVRPHFSQSDLALALGLHRSTVCRILKGLRERGILGDFTKTKLEILDKDALYSLCRMNG